MTAPKRLYGLGWIEVNNLRPERGYMGKSYLNLDQVARIHLPTDQPGVAFLHYADGKSEALEDENCSRVLSAIEDAWINRPASNNEE